MLEKVVTHFDIVFVIWALALGLAWSVVTTSRAQSGNVQASSDQQSSLGWIVNDGGSSWP